jgi:XTP/dITP diphosphohydrolase
MTMTIYVATTNPGKLRDFARAAAGSPIQIEPLPNLAHIPASPEDESTFEGNARSKAIYYSAHAPNALVLADDSGLEVDALDGAPGVRSARYAADQNFSSPAPATMKAPVAIGTDARNNTALLRALSGVPEDCRQARYRCVLALARSIEGRPEVLLTAEGSLDGIVLAAPRGAGGFGYDPLLYLPSLNLTMAELDPTTRLTLSHRGRALRKLLANLAATNPGGPSFRVPS